MTKSRQLRALLSLGFRVWGLEFRIYLEGDEVYGFNCRELLVDRVSALEDIGSTLAAKL